MNRHIDTTSQYKKAMNALHKKTITKLPFSTTPQHRRHQKSRKTNTNKTQTQKKPIRPVQRHHNTKHTQNRPNPKPRPKSTIISQPKLKKHINTKSRQNHNTKSNAHSCITIKSNKNRP